MENFILGQAWAWPWVEVYSSFLPHVLPWPSLLRKGNSSHYPVAGPLMPCGRAGYGQTKGFQQSGGPAKRPSMLDRESWATQPRAGSSGKT